VLSATMGGASSTRDESSHLFQDVSVFAGPSSLSLVRHVEGAVR
jgi:hypothetical protein